MSSPRLRLLSDRRGRQTSAIKPVSVTEVEDEKDPAHRDPYVDLLSGNEPSLVRTLDQ